MSRFIDASEKIIGNEKYLAPIEFSPLDVRLETIEISEKLQKRIFLIAKWEESTFIKMNDQIDESTEAYNFLLKRFKIAV